MGWQRAAARPRGLGLGIRVLELGALQGNYRVGGSISHSSLATSSGQHRSSAAVFLMGDFSLPNLHASRKGAGGTRGGTMEYTGCLELSGCKTKGLPHLCWCDVAYVLRRQLFQECSLACIIQSQEEDPHLLVWGAFQFTQD